MPGLVIGALSFGHLPTILVPAGPMTSGLPNAEKARVRQLYAEGKASREDLLEAESQSYHGPGTCTFYGTANSNQLLMECMGLHLPGSSFVNPGTPLRDALTDAATRRVSQITALGNDYTPAAEVVDAKAVVNGIVGLLATGGSTNHTMHLIAIAAAAGHTVTWQDFDELSAVTPLLARIYPNGNADVNHFQAAGGVPYLISELLGGGLMHDDVRTVTGDGLGAYTREPVLDEGELTWRDGPARSHDAAVLRPLAEPFADSGGIKVLDGNLGRAVIKTSAVAPERHVVEAPARVFAGQHELLDAFDRGELDGDLVAIVRYQGPRANGMPELHKLTPALGILQDRGHAVALVTDGRMSGASGKVPAAIQVTPEAACGGMLARVRDGDIVRLDADAGTLEVKLSDDALAARPPAPWDDARNAHGMGRELFGLFRTAVGGSETGASVFGAVG